MSNIKLPPSVEKTVSLRGLSMAMQCFNDEANPKVLALHGWLDNSQSFLPLAAKLTGFHIIAPDLFGQGKSEHRPASSSYHLWDDVLDMVLLLDALAIEKITIIGHSRGAMLACLLAASFPERVSSIILLDAILPIPVTMGETSQQLRQSVLDFKRAQEYSPRIFTSEEQAIAVRAKASSMNIQEAELILKRSLCKIEGGWVFSDDVRLKSASAIKLTQAHNQQILSSISCKATVIMASEGMGKMLNPDDIKHQAPHFAYHSLNAKHHLHLQSTEEVAKLCLHALS